MKLDEIATIAALMLLFILMAYAIISSASQSAMNVSESDPPTDTRPVIEECDKPLWDRVRSMCES